MNKFLLKIRDVLGIDKAIVYRCSGIMVSTVGGILTLGLIALFFSSEEQGVYYTFSSIAALQVFFELGLTTIIIQYAAHEVVHLEIREDYSLSGPEYHLSRLSSLLHLFVKWYIVTALLIFIILLAGGFVFFYRSAKPLTVAWQLPWILLCLGTSLYFYMNMILAFIEGFGYVKETAKIRVIAQFFGLCVSCICLACGKGLYALGGTAVCYSICSMLLVLKQKYYKMLLEVWRIPISSRLSYFGEIFPYQWKIALSWLSGYFIYQLFNPVLFAFEGAKAAGQMGMSMKVLSICPSLGICWMNTKIPLFSMLIAKKDYSALDSIFNRTIKQVLGIALFSLVVFIAMLEFAASLDIEFNGVRLSERFLPFLPLMLMAVSVFVNQFLSSFGIYLRCHKQEPYMWLSIYLGAACALSTIFVTKYFGMTCMTLSYCLIIIAGNFYGYRIFKQKKMEWHHEFIQSNETDNRNSNV